MINASVGIPVERTARGDYGVSAFVQDQTTPILDLPFLKEVSSSATLAANTVINSNTITLNTGHGTVVGNIIEIGDADGNFIQARVLASGINDVILDTPINRVYLSGSQVVESTDEMIVDGSITPQIFSIRPGPGQAGDLTRLITSITSSADQDFEKFGADPALINGCVLRVKHGDGSFTNVFNWKTNGNFIKRAFDHNYQTNNGGNVRSFVSRRTFAGQSKNGVVIRVDGDLNEEIQIVIQDDLTGGNNTSFKNIAQGHELQR